MERANSSPAGKGAEFDADHERSGVLRDSCRPSVTSHALIAALLKSGSCFPSRMKRNRMVGLRGGLRLPPPKVGSHPAGPFCFSKRTSGNTSRTAKEAENLSA